MPVPETHLWQITRWCRRHVPENARHQLRVEHTTRGSNVTIFEFRAPWGEDAGPEWTRRPIAQLRHDGRHWRLYRPERNSRWTLFPATDAETSPEPLLETIDQPGQSFW